MTGKLLGYARVSTDEQDVALQLDALSRAGVKPEHIDTDAGVSGKLPPASRPAMARILAHATRGDTIVAYALSRVGRSTLDVLTLMRDLDARGIGFRSLTEGIDIATPFGRLALTVLAGVAQFEREVSVERTRAGIRAAQERGTKCGRSSSVSPERRLAVVEAVASGLSVAEAARWVGVSESTARRLVGRP